MRTTTFQEKTNSSAGAGEPDQGHKICSKEIQFKTTTLQEKTNSSAGVERARSRPQTRNKEIQLKTSTFQQKTNSSAGVGEPDQGHKHVTRKYNQVFALNFRRLSAREPSQPGLFCSRKSTPRRDRPSCFARRGAKSGNGQTLYAVEGCSDRRQQVPPIKATAEAQEHETKGKLLRRYDHSLPFCLPSPPSVRPSLPPSLSFSPPPLSFTIHSPWR